MTFTKIVVVLSGVVALVACDRSSSMVMSPSPTSGSPQGQGSLSVNNAAVLVGGDPVQGTVSLGTGERALFQVQVTAPQGLSSVEHVVMQYTQPGPNHHGGPMMGGYNGLVLCYDDGTHGDYMPGDGIYHYMDPDDQIGCHGLSSPAGEYHYSFWAEGANGQRSNTATVTIVRE